VSHPVLTPRLCRIARAMLNWTYEDVKRFSGVDRMRVHRFEAGRPVRDAEMVAATLRKLFEAAGLRFHKGSISYPPEWTHEPIQLREPKCP
jgi:hypothetical protein